MEGTFEKNSVHNITPSCFFGCFHNYLRMLTYNYPKFSGYLIPPILKEDYMKLLTALPLLLRVTLTLPFALHIQ